MKYLLRTCFLTLLLSCGLLSAQKATANNAAAGEIMYQWVSGSTYDLYVKFYRVCSGAPEPASLSLCYNNTCNSYQGTLLLNKISGNLPPAVSCGLGPFVPSGCPGLRTTCQDPASSVPGYEEYWYSARITLPVQCDFWRFSTVLSNRNPAIMNLANPSATALRLEATLYSAAGTGENPGNSSPCMLLKPIIYIISNIPNSYLIGGVDLDGDSLTYELIMPQDQGSGCSGVNTTFSSASFNLFSNPLATGNTFFLAPGSRQMSFTPTMSQTANIAIRIKEYQNGVLRGTSMREIQFAASPVINMTPMIIPPTNVTGGQVVNGIYGACAGQLLQFCFQALARDSAARLTAYDNHNNPTPGIPPAVPGASLVYNNLFSDSLNICLSWTPTLRDTGLHTLTINIFDTACHMPGQLSQSAHLDIPIYIHSAPTAGTIITTGQAPTYTFQARGVSNATGYHWDFGDGTTDTVLTPTHTYQAPGPYTVTFNAKNDCGVSSSKTVLTLPSAITEAAIPASAIQLFPSPATHSVTIQNTASQAMKTIRILDITGSLVREVKATGTKVQEVDISALVSGIYLVRVELADGTVALRRLQVSR